MKSSIYLHRGEGVWLATHQGPAARAVVELMGGPTVPTAWLAAADAETVGEEIARLNPGVLVYTVVGDTVLEWTAAVEEGRADPVRTEQTPHYRDSMRDAGRGRMAGN